MTPIASPHLSRRAALVGLAAAALTGRARAAGPALGPPRPFSWDGLKAEARALAAIPYAPPPSPAADIVRAIDYLDHRAIAQPRDRGLWTTSGADAPVTFFHLGRLFPRPVRMHALEGGAAREVLYDRASFVVPPGNPAERMPPDAGFAGFRIHDPPGETPPGASDDWIAFLGASYFRMRGDGGEYGLSARGVAIDTALAEPGPREEFPEFRAFFIEPMRDGRATIHALLDGPAVAGAFRFRATRAPAAVEVEAEMTLRRDVGRLGLAPLTSMFWYGAINRFAGDDWRPAVHDSEGLAIQGGNGERLWRPLNNPPRLTVSAFRDAGPRGFGLVQRQRAFEHFQDGHVRFERRPSAYVEPIGDWGPGAVQLLEIPTRVEFEDNVGAFWVPDAPARAGARFNPAYRLRWPIDDPSAAEGLAHVVATRFSKIGDIDGARARRMIVDFEGDGLAAIEPVPESLDLALPPHAREFARGLVRHPGGDLRRWRAFLTIAQDGDAPVEARLTLRGADGRPTSETWNAQLHASD